MVTVTARIFLTTVNFLVNKKVVFYNDVFGWSGNYPISFYRNERSFIFLFTIVLVYYIIAKKYQWLFLLISSYLFYAGNSISGCF